MTAEKGHASSQTDSEEPVSNAALIDKYVHMDIEDFRKRIIGLIGKMNYRIIDIKSTLDDGLNIYAKHIAHADTGGVSEEIRYAIQVKRRVTAFDEHLFREFMEFMHERHADNGIIITTSYFNESVKEEAHALSIKLVDSVLFVELLKEYDMDEKEGYDEEEIFDFSMSPRLAQIYFEGRVRRSILLGRHKEKIGIITAGYIPFSVFEIVVKKPIRGDRILRNTNLFYVNLADGNIYRLVALGKKVHRFEKNDIIKKVLILPEDAKKLLYEIITHDLTHYDELKGKNLTILKQYGFVDVKHHKKRSDSFILNTLTGIALFMHDIVYSVVHPSYERGGTVVNAKGAENIPVVHSLIEEGDLMNQTYNLERYFGPSLVGKTDLLHLARNQTEHFDEPTTRKMNHVEIRYELKPEEYSHESILAINENIFGGRIHFKKVVYMPFYECIYEQEEGYHHHETILVPCPRDFKKEALERAGRVVHKYMKY